MSKSRLGQAHKLLGIADALSRNTRFSFEECKLLCLFHQKIVACSGNLDRLRFRDVLYVTFDITDDIMLDFVFRTFDRNNDGIIDVMEWIRGLSTMIRGTLEELVEFTYFVYDMNGDRSLAREELYHCLKGCIHTGYGLDTDEVEECEREIVEIAMKKLDVDKDGQITFPDFQNAVIADPLLLQACGPCLPSQRSCAAFLALITFKYRVYSGVWMIPWNDEKKKEGAKKKDQIRKGSLKPKQQGQDDSLNTPSQITLAANTNINAQNLVSRNPTGLSISVPFGFGGKLLNNDSLA